MENAHDMRFIFYHKRNIDEGRDSVYTFVNMLEQAQIRRAELNSRLLRVKSDEVQ